MTMEMGPTSYFLKDQRPSIFCLVYRLSYQSQSACYSKTGLYVWYNGFPIFICQIILRLQGTIQYIHQRTKHNHDSMHWYILVRITLYQLGIELNEVFWNVTMVNSSFKMFLNTYNLTKWHLGGGSMNKLEADVTCLKLLFGDLLFF